MGSIASAFTGAVSSCLTGPVNAIISGSGEKHRHYTAGVMVGLLALLFGAMSTTFTRLLLATPPAFIAALGGLAMLRVLQTAFTVSFGSGKFALGALVTFLVTVADVGIAASLAAFATPQTIAASLLLWRAATLHLCLAGGLVAMWVLRRKAVSAKTGEAPVAP